jgi:hypothetical protein
MEQDRFVYSEKRTINIGQYENIEIFASYGCSIKTFNLVDKTVEIYHSESSTIDEEKEAFTDTAKKTMNRVRNVLNIREHKIREGSAPYVDFPSLNKFKETSVYKES